MILFLLGQYDGPGSDAAPLWTARRTLQQHLELNPPWGRFGMLTLSLFFKVITLFIVRMGEGLNLPFPSCWLYTLTQPSTQTLMGMIWSVAKMDSSARLLALVIQYVEPAEWRLYIFIIYILFIYGRAPNRSTCVTDKPLNHLSLQGCWLRGKWYFRVKPPPPSPLAFESHVDTPEFCRCWDDCSPWYCPFSTSWSGCSGSSATGPSSPSS